MYSSQSFGKKQEEGSEGYTIFEEWKIKHNNRGENEFKLQICIGRKLGFIMFLVGVHSL